MPKYGDVLQQSQPQPIPEPPMDDENEMSEESEEEEPCRKKMVKASPKRVAFEMSSDPDSDEGEEGESDLSYEDGEDID